jgi:hypothetical protein
MLKHALKAVLCAVTALPAPRVAPAQRTARETAEAAALERVLATLSPQQLEAPFRFLADDLLEGRAPGTRGGELAAKYLASQFAGMGLRPAGPDGSFYQWIPLVGLRPEVSFVVGAQGRTLVLQDGTEIVAWPERADSIVTLDAEIVFAGYGISAPQWGWDDYKGAAQTGRIVMVLSGEPTLEDTSAFRGPAPTGYALWQHKVDQAARMGAVGVILIWTPDYPLPWEAVRRTWSGEHLALDRPPQHSLRFAAWVTLETARRLVETTGKDFPTLLRRATLPGFQPVDLGARAAVDLRSRLRRFRAPNVVAKLDGADSLGRTEAVLLAAHYDHLGVGLPERGDSIYNGAVDNASGVAVLLAVANALARAPTPPRRSVVFLAPTAEEAGALGSAAYLGQPAVRLEQTAALVALDGAAVWGPTADVLAIGAEWSSLDSVAAAAARAANLELAATPPTMVADFYLGGPAVFARAGVPAMLLRPGLRFRSPSPASAADAWAHYLADRYHRPGDEVPPEFDRGGLLQQARFATRVVWALSQTSQFPVFRPGSEFRAAGQRLRPPR